MDDRETGDPRVMFAAALTRLRRRLPDVSDETLARRASAVVLPSGRRVAVNARRLGEWANGQSVPRKFEAVMVLVQAVERAAGGASAEQPTVAHWQQLWRAARDYRSSPAAGQPPSQPQSQIVIGRPPSDAAALRRRDGLSDSIDAGMQDPSVRQILLTGAGGVGKSQLASAAFHRAKQRAEILLWVPAGDRLSVLGSYARAWRVLSGVRIAGITGSEGEAPLPGIERGGDDETQADLFLTWLRSTATPWLVVLDDIDDPGELAGLWPAGDAGRTVLVSRRRDATLLRPGVRVIPVGVFTADEATAYLADRLLLEMGDLGPAARHHGSQAHRREDLAALAAMLGHFPLALSQAAAFLIDTGMHLPAYLSLLADRRESVAALLPPSSPADEHGGTVTSTLQLALGRAESLAPRGTVRAMLELISMFAPDGIPDAVLLGSAAREWLGGGPVPERGPLLALRALHRLSLVTHHGPAGPAVVDVHSLVQRAIRDEVPPDRRERLATAAADALEEVWSAPDCEPETETVLYRSAEVLLAHADGHLWRAGGLHPLLRRFGQHLTALGRPAAALDMAQGLADRARRRLGDGHRDVLTLRAQAAQAEGDLGGTAAALRSLGRIRREAEGSLGRTDPDTLSIRLQEARFRMESGLIDAALADFVTLAADARATLGAGDPVVTDADDHVALCRGLSGDAHGARDGYAAIALELERDLGPSHPRTLKVLTDLSRWIGETGDVRLAVTTYQQAVDGLASVLGRLHPETLIARHNLAYWHGIAGELDRAVEQFVTAADDAELALGAEHPTTLTYQVNLAFWRGVAGDTAAALHSLEGLRPTLERVLGADHPRTLRARQQQAELLYRRGDHTTAADRLTTLLTDMVRIQGANHPRTREAEQLLARWSREQAAVVSRQAFNATEKAQVAPDAES
ncbi:tetratricopeptide repeat protein [Streptomyces sp. NPDC001663]|uniref:tetratricopeptide repeat protein n=1 Tax=Streptomyces sp. NPDC001663 TaxID=3364597 RepID=UPI003685AE83